MRRTPRQVLYDVLAWLVLSVLAAAAGPDPFAEPGVFAVVTGGRVLLLGLAVLVGRAWPLAASVILLPLGPWDFGEGLATTSWDFTGGVATTDQLWPLSLVSVKIFPLSTTTLAVLWYAYRTGRSASRAWPATAVFGAAAVIGAGVVLAQGGLLRYWVTMVSGLIGCYVVPYLLGTLRRLLLQQRERTQLSVAAQARLRERTRIAHDMHDSLGHDLALIAVRAAGLEIAPGLAPAQAKAAGELRVAASEATERLREIVGLLRDDFDPAPSYRSPPTSPTWWNAPATPAWTSRWRWRRDPCPRWPTARSRKGSPTPPSTRQARGCASRSRQRGSRCATAPPAAGPPRFPAAWASPACASAYGWRAAR
ncbi:sensor histidine kinase [Nonomuraea recticatena]|uniref:sensor histidine kinase n=1 Tax=Nonomuraea recticatena TaxID=46178 RepID=UPI003608F554